MKSMSKESLPGQGEQVEMVVEEGHIEQIERKVEEHCKIQAERMVEWQLKVEQTTRLEPQQQRRWGVGYVVLHTLERRSR